jgi:glycosyltransferase involved in cell wall biosynthesis
VKIGFQIYAGSRWLAGQTAVADTLHALRSLGADTPELALVVWPSMGPQDHTALRPLVDEVIHVPQRSKPPVHRPSRRQRVQRWLTGAGAAPPPAELPTPAEVLQQHRVDCLFATPDEKRPDLDLPVLLWLPDLQHVHLPEFISADERASRDRLYRRELSAATLVYVTAEAVRRDLAAYAPDDAHKVRVVPPVAVVPASIYANDPQPLVETYHLPERFFWLPNQFWQHKNHVVVMEALRLLRSRSVYPSVVCTGNTFDHRSPDHMANLLRKLSLWNLREQFILLGLLPYAEVLGLMRQALCVLNPSLFEGFGLSVAEGSSIGKRALLSDLPAHREQDPPGATYFDPRDARDLADKMEAIWKTGRPGPDLDLEAAARAALPQRQLAFGRAFLSVAEETVRLGQSRSHIRA